MSIPGVPAIHWQSNAQGVPGISPETQTVKVGETATFTVDAAIIAHYAPVTSIQWYKNQQLIPGATGATYTTPPATLADNFSYYIPFINGIAAGGYSGLITVSWMYVYPENTKVIDWKHETEHTDWSDRDSIEPLVFGGKLWIFGGWKGSSEMLGDVWNSSDGVNWNIVITNAPWSTPDHKGLDMHMTTVFAGKMWVMGGANVRISNEVWNSTDGVVWTKVGNAQWPARAAATLVVFGGKMILMGGNGAGGILYNDIWSSTDGAMWKQETANAAWSPRVDLRAVVFRNKVFVMGGLNTGFLNEVWESSDGINYSKIQTPPWKPRHWFQPVVYRNHIFVFAGETYAPASQLNDCWYSLDGITWKQLFSKNVFRQKHGQGAAVFNDKIIMFGGSDFRWGFPQVSNSVWSLFVPEGFPDEQPSTTSTSTTTKPNTTSTSTTTKNPTSTTTSTTTQTPVPTTTQTPPTSGQLRIITQPNKFNIISQGETETETVTVSVIVAGGTPPYKYRWRKNGYDIIGANKASFTTGETGDYAVNILDQKNSFVRSDPVYVRGGTNPITTSTSTTTNSIDPVAENQTVTIKLEDSRADSFRITEVKKISPDGVIEVGFVAVNSDGEEGLPAKLTIIIK